MPTSKKPGPRPLPQLEGLGAYTPPRSRFQVDLRLDGNEGVAPPARLLDELRRAGSEVMQRYPDDTALQALVAERIGVEPARVLMTAGGDDAIDRTLRAFLAPGRQLIQPEPTFEMIARYARLTGAEVTSVPWPRGAYPLDEVLAAAGPNTAVIALVSPNNPTGAVLAAEDLRKLAQAVPGALLLVDLAYTEFADEDLTPVALEIPNAVLIRTLSKAWGLAGLRVGYAIGPAPIIATLRAAGHPYPISRPSLALAHARMLEAGQEVCGFVDRVRWERSELQELLTRLGAHPLPSQANFVLAGFKDPGFVHDALGALGIAVRSFPGRADLEGCLRITCPGEAEAFDRLCAGLHTALAPEGLLFDMDGVLADVSGSYRQAIVATARTFGVVLEAGEVSAAKAVPGSNNDWEVTRRLLQHHGIEAELAEVTRRFEDAYQGTAERPGLHQTERLIPDRNLLERLSSRLPLAVVTGRPRSDAERFLDVHGLADCFSTLVCMEDGPAKPDPAPVRQALSSLKISTAWMMGDTPDDILAARQARVLPLGLVAPAEDKNAARRALGASGAARVLDDAACLEDLLP